MNKHEYFYSEKIYLIVIPLAIVLSLTSYFLPSYFFNKTQIQAPNVLDIDTAEAQPGVISASPSIVTLNEPTNITITIEITDTRLIPTSVNLQRLDETGKAIAILGNLNDNGTNGDTLAGDKIFSTAYTFTEATTTPVYLRVSWALKGVLRRVVSNTLSVEVWQELVIANGTVSFAYPTRWELSIQDSAVFFDNPVLSEPVVEDCELLDPPCNAEDPPEIALNIFDNASSSPLDQFVGNFENGWYLAYKHLNSLTIREIF